MSHAAKQASGVGARSDSSQIQLRQALVLKLRVLVPPVNLIGRYEDRLSVNGYFHDVADDDAAFVHRVVAAYAELLPVD